MVRPIIERHIAGDVSLAQRVWIAAVLAVTIASAVVFSNTRVWLVFSFQCAE